MGYLIGLFGKSVKYHIISNDKGFVNVCNYWVSKGYTVLFNEDNDKLLSSNELRGKFILNKMSYSIISDISKHYLRNKNNKQSFHNWLHKYLHSRNYSDSDISCVYNYLKSKEDN